MAFAFQQQFAAVADADENGFRTGVGFVAVGVIRVGRFQFHRLVVIDRGKGKRRRRFAFAFFLAFAFFGIGRDFAFFSPFCLGVFVTDIGDFCPLREVAGGGEVFQLRLHQVSLRLYAQLFDARQFAIGIDDVQQGAGGYFELVFVIHDDLFQRFCLRLAHFNARLVFAHLQSGNFGALHQAVVDLRQFGLCGGGLVAL